MAGGKSTWCMTPCGVAASILEFHHAFTVLFSALLTFFVLILMSFQFNPISHLTKMRKIRILTASESKFGDVRANLSIGKYWSNMYRHNVHNRNQHFSHMLHIHQIHRVRKFYAKSFSITVAFQ